MVAATHVDLEGAVKAGKFRQDLFHRLAVLRVTLPPLRERPEDIPLLIDTVLGAHGQAARRRCRTRRAPCSPSTPGRATCASCATWWSRWSTSARRPCPRCPAWWRSPAPRAPRSRAAERDLPFKEAKERLIDGFERDYLKGLLERCEGNISRAAREAGIDRVYLRKLLRKHGLEDRDE